jgi:hypothetical protein
MESVVQLTAIQATKLSEEIKVKDEVSFEINAALTEVKRSPAEMVIKFEIEIEPQPSIAKLSLIGFTKLKGEVEEIEAHLAAQEGKPPKIFMLIYQKVYPILYLLCCSLNIPSPGPKLLVNTQILVGAQEVMQSVEP